MRSVLQQAIDLLLFVERIVQVEIEFGHHAHLLSHAAAQRSPQLVGMIADAVERGLLVLHGEEADIHLGEAQVRAHANTGDGDEAARKKLPRELLDHLGELFLEQAVHLVLPEAVHRFCAKGREDRPGLRKLAAAAGLLFPGTFAHRMRNFLKILRFGRPYRRYAVWNGVFNVFATLFHLGSMLLLVPFLQLLMKQTEPVRTRPPFALDGGTLKQTFNWSLTRLIDTQGELAALAIICCGVVALFLLKNVFRYLAVNAICVFRNRIIHDVRSRIYDKMLTLMENNRAIDPITLQEVLRQAGDLDLIGGPAAIGALIDGVPRFSNIQEYCRIVKGKSIVRKLITTSNQIINRCFDAEDEPDILLDEAERSILAIAEDRIRQGFVPIGEVAHKQLTQIEETAQNDRLVTGIGTEYKDLDLMTSGLQRGDLIIVAARPSMGKTAFCLNIAQNAALAMQDHGRGAIVGIFSLEMSKEQLVNRLLCSQARIDAHRLRTGMLAKDDWKRLAESVSELAETKIFLDDTPAISALEMRAKCRRLKNEQRGLDLIIVDYLQLMSGKGKTDSRQQEVSQISRDLKALAKEMNAPVIALSQLSRAVETRSDHRPQLSDLRESGSIEQDADLVLFIYRDEVYNAETEKQNIAEIIISKQRNGPIGDVELVFLKQFTKFENKYRE